MAAARILALGLLAVAPPGCRRSGMRARPGPSPAAPDADAPEVVRDRYRTREIDTSLQADVVARLDLFANHRAVFCVETPLVACATAGEAPADRYAHAELETAREWMTLGRPPRHWMILGERPIELRYHLASDRGDLEQIRLR
jgi:hypothetical protein